MLTIENLQNLGNNTKEGLSRCLNNEAFYLRLVNKAMNDDRLAKLKEALDAKDYQQAFEHAHALKGIYGNLSLTILFDPIVELTEHLRAKEEMDYNPLINILLENEKKIKELM